MSEAAFWEAMRNNLRPFGIMKRVENSLDLGTPDVSYCLRFRSGLPASGWIELKEIPAWPARGGPLVIKHFTLNQLIWLEEWAARDGRAWLLMRIGTEIVICNPAVARLVYKQELNRERLRQGATGIWQSRPFPVKGLLEVLTG